MTENSKNMLKRIEDIFVKMLTVTAFVRFLLWIAFVLLLICIIFSTVIRKHPTATTTNVFTSQQYVCSLEDLKDEGKTVVYTGPDGERKGFYMEDFKDGSVSTFCPVHMMIEKSGISLGYFTSDKGHYVRFDVDNGSIDLGDTPVDEWRISCKNYVWDSDNLAYGYQTFVLVPGDNVLFYLDHDRSSWFAYTSGRTYRNEYSWQSAKSVQLSDGQISELIRSFEQLSLADIPEDVGDAHHYYEMSVSYEKNGYNCSAIVDGEKVWKLLTDIYEQNGGSIDEGE